MSTSILEKLSIQPASEADLADIQKLLFEIFQEPQFNQSEKGHTLWERMKTRYEHDPEKNARDFWGPDRSRRFAVTVREKGQGNDLVGVAWIMAAAGDTALGELNKLYLRKDCRGNGLGKYVLELLLSEARKLGFTAIYLITGRELTDAIALYQRFGFVDVPQDRYKNSPNSIAMQLDLGTCTAL